MAPGTSSSSFTRALGLLGTSRHRKKADRDREHPQQPNSSSRSRQTMPFPPSSSRPARRRGCWPPRGTKRSTSTTHTPPPPPARTAPTARWFGPLNTAPPFLTSASAPTTTRLSAPAWTGTSTALTSRAASRRRWASTRRRCAGLFTARSTVSAPFPIHSLLLGCLRGHNTASRTTAANGGVALQRS